MTGNRFENLTAELRDDDFRTRMMAAKDARSVPAYERPEDATPDANPAGEDHE